ncbi:MAG: hypothetical protein FWG52_06365 [Proteobacteria bacterium]|nr:hypothetical protein [Pseudomonadota bacterium]
MKMWKVTKKAFWHIAFLAAVLAGCAGTTEYVKSWQADFSNSRFDGA